MSSIFLLVFRRSQKIPLYADPYYIWDYTELKFASIWLPSLGGTCVRDGLIWVASVDVQMKLRNYKALYVGFQWNVDGTVISRVTDRLTD